MSESIMIGLQDVIRKVRTEVDEREEFWGGNDDKWENSQEGKDYIKKTEELDTLLSDLETTYKDLEVLYE